MLAGAGENFKWRCGIKSNYKLASVCMKSNRGGMMAVWFTGVWGGFWGGRGGQGVGRDR